MTPVSRMLAEDARKSLFLHVSLAIGWWIALFWLLLRWVHIDFVASFLVYGSIPIVMSAAGYAYISNRHRFRLGTFNEERDINTAYEREVEMWQDHRAGLRHVLEVIETQSADPCVERTRLLEYLAKRKDRIGEIAAQELGTQQPPGD